MTPGSQILLADLQALATTANTKLSQGTPFHFFGRILVIGGPDVYLAGTGRRGQAIDGPVRPAETKTSLTDVLIGDIAIPRYPLHSPGPAYVLTAYPSSDAANWAAVDSTLLQVRRDQQAEGYPSSAAYYFSVKEYDLQEAGVDALTGTWYAGDGALHGLFRYDGPQPGWPDGWIPCGRWAWEFARLKHYTANALAVRRAGYADYRRGGLKAAARVSGPWPFRASPDTDQGGLGYAGNRVGCWTVDGPGDPALFMPLGGGRILKDLALYYAADAAVNGRIMLRPAATMIPMASSQSRSAVGGGSDALPPAGWTVLHNNHVDEVIAVNEWRTGASSGFQLVTDTAGHLQGTLTATVYGAVAEGLIFSTPTVYEVLSDDGSLSYVTAIEITPALQDFAPGQAHTIRITIDAPNYGGGVISFKLRIRDSFETFKETSTWASDYQLMDFDSIGSPFGPEDLRFTIDGFTSSAVSGLSSKAIHKCTFNSDCYSLALPGSTNPAVADVENLGQIFYGLAAESYSNPTNGFFWATSIPLGILLSLDSSAAAIAPNIASMNRSGDAHFDQNGKAINLRIQPYPCALQSGQPGPTVPPAVITFFSGGIIGGIISEIAVSRVPDSSGQIQSASTITFNIGGGLFSSSLLPGQNSRTFRQSVSADAFPIIPVFSPVPITFQASAPILIQAIFLPSQPTPNYSGYNASQPTEPYIPYLSGNPYLTPPIFTPDYADLASLLALI